MLDTIENWTAEQLANDAAAAATDLPSERAAALERLRSRAAKVRANLATKEAELTRLYFKALRGNGSSDEIEAVAQVLTDQERAAIEILAPRIETLRQKLAARPAPDPELQGAIDLALRWLGLYRLHRQALSKLASERQGVPPEVLKARPIERIDYQELIREHMARYPKIRAELAK